MKKRIFLLLTLLLLFALSLGLMGCGSSGGTVQGGDTDKVYTFTLSMALLYDTVLSILAIFREDVAKLVQADWT